MKYEVTCTRYGVASVEANSMAEAMEKVDHMETTDIQWFDDWSATDCEDEEE